MKRMVKKEPFFSFLGDSILGAGRLILIIAANVIAFVALAALIDKVLGLFNPWLSLEHILGIIMFPFAWLMGLDVDHAFQFAQYMGTKLVTNEFVVMGKIAPTIHDVAKYGAHYQAQLTVFLTSFANFSTTGMIIGAFKGLANKESNNLISKKCWLHAIVRDLGFINVCRDRGSVRVVEKVVRASARSLYRVI